VTTARIEIPAAERRQAPTRASARRPRPERRRRRVPVGWVVVAILFALWLTGWLLAQG
jgi:ferric-dicitrate binding protein FerR (iron transport regulator)